MQEIVLYICSKEHKKSNIKSQSVYVCTDFTQLGYRQTRPQKQAVKIIISLGQLYIISAETTVLRRLKNGVKQLFNLINV